MKALSPNHWAAREFSVYVNVVLSHSYKEETRFRKRKLEIYVSFGCNLKHEKYVKETTQRYIIIKLHRRCNKENILKASRKKKETLWTNKDKEYHRFLVRNNVSEKTIKQQNQSTFKRAINLEFYTYGYTLHK